MIEKSKYRLGEYQISEYGDGVLWGHAHCGLGQQRSGKCIIIGDILVVGPFSHEENGFLKREFLERLKKLPIWERTKFYCFASELIDVSSSRSLAKISSDCIISFGRVHRFATQAARDEIPGVFRLHKYKIAVAGDGRISWEALEGRDLLVGGQCIIKSGILFINSKKHQTREKNRQEFHEKLKEMPPWKGTKVWSHSRVLRPCDSPPQTGRGNSKTQRYAWHENRYPESTFSTLCKANQIKLKSLWPQDIKFRMPPLPVPRLSSLRLPKRSQFSRKLRKLCFALLIPLLLVGSILGFIFGWHYVEETSHRHHASEKLYHR